MRPVHGLAGLPAVRAGRGSRVAGGRASAGPLAGDFPPRRARIVELACPEPVARGLHVTHWSSEDLARQAVADGVVGAISPRAVRPILAGADLQPHRARYWKTAGVGPLFKARAEKVLWCYGTARRLAAEGVWTVAVGEVPNFHVLERGPVRRAVPGHV